MYQVYFVDDSNAEQKLLNLLVRIKKLPLQVTTFPNPVEALEALDRASEAEWPHVIISDIKMPMMDGFEFADNLWEKYLPHRPQTLFFLCSSTIRQQDIERAKAHPAVASFMEKPLNNVKLTSQVLARLPKIDQPGSF